MTTAQRSAHGTVEPVHGRVFGNRAAHLITPRGVGRDLFEECSGVFEGAHPFRAAVDRANQPPVLGATVGELDDSYVSRLSTNVKSSTPSASTLER